MSTRRRVGGTASSRYVCDFGEFALVVILVALHLPAVHARCPRTDDLVVSPGLGVGSRSTRLTLPRYLHSIYPLAILLCPEYLMKTAIQKHSISSSYAYAQSSMSYYSNERKDHGSRPT